MAVNKALNPASEAWGRDVEKRNSENEQALVRATMDLQNTDRAQQDALTRLNTALATVRSQNDYILSLAVKHVATATGDIALTSGAWTTNNSIRPSITLMAPTGRIRIVVSAYGHNSVLTYSIAGVVAKEAATASYVAQSAQLVLPGGSVSMTTQKEWVQVVPRNVLVTVQLECKGVGDAPVVASPALTVQVLPE